MEKQHDKPTKQVNTPTPPNHIHALKHNESKDPDR